MYKDDNDVDQQGARRSKRQRVPNQYYTIGLNQPKKIENAPRVYRKNKNQNDDSDQDERNISTNYKYIETENKNTDQIWLPCILPNNRQIKVQIVFDESKKQQAIMVKQKAKDQIIAKNNSKGSFSFLQNLNMNSAKKQESTFDLLSLFKQAIHSVQQDPKPINIKNAVDIQKNATQSLTKVKPLSIMPLKRLYQQDKDGRILSINMNQSQALLYLNHTKLGIYQIPIQNFAQKVKSQYTCEQQQTIEEWRQKIQNSGILQSISLFN